MLIEAIRSVNAAWRIMRQDLQGFDDLNLTVEGFWRSFAAIFALLPMIWIVAQSYNSVAVNSPDLQSEMGSVSNVLLRAIVSWILWPVVVGVWVHVFKLGAGYVKFVVTYNWMAVIMGALVCFPHILHLLGVLSFPLTGLAGLLIVGVALYYSWYLARVALLASPGVATLFAFSDFALSVTLEQLLG